MQLLVAYQEDPAGHNMAKFISRNLKEDGDIYRGKNFDLVIIPCHRVIQANGKIGGYAYGKEVKTNMLQIEGTIGFIIQFVFSVATFGQ